MLKLKKKFREGDHWQYCIEVLKFGVLPNHHQISQQQPETETNSKCFNLSQAFRQGEIDISPEVYHLLPGTRMLN
jgi:hypothetical protein